MPSARTMLIAALFGLVAPHHPALADGGPLTLAQFQGSYGAVARGLDVDGDGSVSQWEALTGGRRDLWRLWDRDGDGVARSSEVRRHAARLFLLADRNLDGILSGSEKAAFDR
ncbi:MAG: hypothetical protein ACPGNT_01255 [Rhodospirillales bacterium]